MKVVFMGTPDFSVPTLQALIDSEHEVAAVFTQPDKPKGRSKKMQASPVKEAALKAGITVYQPQKVRDPEFVEILENIAPEVIVVVAYGQILTKQILELPKYGCINVHASLLPKLRGAAPIQWSVIQGDKESGVTIMQMDEGIDTGDILLVKKYELAPKETGGSLFDHLASLGGPMILEALKQAENGTLHPIPQEDEKHTYAKMLKKSLGELDFTREAVELERLIRGLNPWPSAYTHLNGKMLKIWEADVVEDIQEAEPGVLGKIEKDSFCIQTGKGALEIHALQLEGKKRMDAESFLRGYELSAGTKLGNA